MQEEAIKRIEKTIEMYNTQLADLEGLFGRSTKGNRLRKSWRKRLDFLITY